MLYMRGFTVVELAITITVISILATIAVYVPRQYLVNARDQERFDDTATIARRLEQAYTSQELSKPAYPTASKLATDITGLSGTVSRLKSESFQAPGASSSSVVAANSTSTVTPLSGAIALNQYVYQPINDTNTLCSGSETCIRFNLYYKKESDGSLQRIKSIHQQ